MQFRTKLDENSMNFFRSQTRYDTIPEVPLLMPLTNDLLYLFTVLEVMFDIEM